MIITNGADGENSLLILGLTKENVRNLVAGEPMKIKRATHGNGIPINLTIIIHYGETEESLVLELAPAAIPGARIFKMPPGVE